MVQLLWKTVQWLLKKLTTELPYDTAFPLMSIDPKELKAGTDICTPMFIVALFTTAKRWKLPKCPRMGERIRKTWYTHTMESFSALKRKFIKTWVNLEGIIQVK